MTKSNHIDLTNLLNRINKYALGFEPAFRNFESSMYGTTNYPPYNVIKHDNDDIRLEVAIAGFSKENITIEHHNSKLTIKGCIETDEDVNFHHKGISTRDFTLSWTLAEYVEVDSANVENGILTVELKQNIPEEKQPKLIKIL